MDLHVRYMLGGHLLMILIDCLDLLVPKEALTTSVHNKLIKQFFRHNRSGTLTGNRVSKESFENGAHKWSK